MQTLIGLMLAVALALLPGCASFSPPIDNAEEVDPSKGVLLAGLSTGGSYQVKDAWFFYRLKGTTDEHRLDAFSFAGSMARGLFGRLVPTTNHFSGSGPEVGRLVAYPLEPGEYELYSWTLYVDRAGGYGYVSPKNRPPPHSFKIQAGTITYLGGLHVNAILGPNTLGFDMVFGGDPDIRDRSDRDLSLLKSLYPTIAGWPIQKSVPDGAQWKILH